MRFIRTANGLRFAKLLLCGEPHPALELRHPALELRLFFVWINNTVFQVVVIAHLDKLIVGGNSVRNAHTLDNILLCYIGTANRLG